MKQKNTNLLWFYGRYAALLLIVLLRAAVLTAQEVPVSVKGLIENEKGEALEGVTVQLVNDEKTIQQTAVTNEQGIFLFQRLNSRGGYTFTVTHVGYEKKVIRKNQLGTAKENALLITLKAMNAELDNVVVVGYGAQSKARITGAVSQLKSDQFKDMPVTGIDQALAGQMAGVQVSQYSGVPGGGISVKVRGLGSVTAGNQPLYVIDGFPVNNPNISTSISTSNPANNGLSTINVNDVETIDVLKDAAAAAIYGSRGSNGVVIITTKKGRQSKPRFALDSYYGIQSVVRTIPMMDAYEYSRYVADARNNWWTDQKPTNSASDPNSVRNNVVAKIPDFMQPYLANQPGLTNTNWQDAIFRHAPVQSYDLSVTGGTDNTTYFISGNYFNQEGIVINSGFKRYSVRANIESKLSKAITLGVNLAPSFTQQQIISEGGHGNDGVITTALIAMPNFPIYNADGTYALGNQAREASKYSMAVLENPVALANLLEDNISGFRTLGSAYLDIRLLKGLKFKTYFGADYFSSVEQYYRPSVLGIYRVAPPSQATGKSLTNNVLNWVSEHTLTYTPQLNGGHNLTVLAGYTMQKENWKDNSITGTNFPNDQVHTISAATTISAASSRVQEWSLLSYVGRATYDYNSKYLFSASLRRDGSSRFGVNHQWGLFPAASVGWRLSKESFFPANNAVNDVKLRASYGQTGNFQIPNYGSYGLLASNNYVLNGGVVNGQAPNTAPNPDLSWEKTSQINVGADISLLQSAMTLTVDYYNSQTKDLLLNVPLPYASGYTSMLKNVGRVSNKGFEIMLSGKASIGAVSWTGSLNVSANKNRVEELGPGQTQIISNRNITKIGEPIGAYYGYQVLGVFKDQKALDAYPHLSTSVPGSYIYEDVTPDNKIDANDRKVIGSPFPKYTAGLTSNFAWKGIDLGFLINTVQGFQITQTLKTTYLVSEEGWANTSQDMYDNRYISAAQPGGGYGRARVQPTDTYYRNSSLTVEDASFVRVRSITLGYKMPASVLHKAGIGSLRIYLTAQNPFTFTAYKGYNPEASSNGANALEPGQEGGAYPAAKSFVAGLNVNF